MEWQSAFGGGSDQEEGGGEELTEKWEKIIMNPVKINIATN